MSLPLQAPMAALMKSAQRNSYTLATSMRQYRRKRPLTFACLALLAIMLPVAITLPWVLGHTGGGAALEEWLDPGRSPGNGGSHAPPSRKSRTPSTSSSSKKATGSASSSASKSKGLSKSSKSSSSKSEKDSPKTSNTFGDALFGNWDFPGPPPPAKPISKGMMAGFPGRRNSARFAAEPEPAPPSKFPIPWHKERQDCKHQITEGSLIDAVLRLAGNYLEHSMRDSGAMNYELNWISGFRSPEDLGWHQASGFWGLAQLYGRKRTLAHVPGLEEATRSATAFWTGDVLKVTPSGSAYVIYEDGWGKRNMVVQDEGGGNLTTVCGVLLGVIELLTEDERFSDVDAEHSRRLSMLPDDDGVGSTSPPPTFITEREREKLADVSKQLAKFVVGAFRNPPNIPMKPPSVRKGKNPPSAQVKVEVSRFNCAFNAQGVYEDSGRDVICETQAMLALVMAAKYDGMPLPPWLLREVEISVQDYVDTTSTREETRLFYVYGCRLLFELTTDWEGGLASGDRAASFGDHLLSLATWMISKHKAWERTSNNAYAYEGLALAFRVAALRKDATMMDTVNCALDNGLRLISRFQLGNALAWAEMNEDSGGVPFMYRGGAVDNVDSSYIRVDIVQRFVQAFLLSERYWYPDRTERKAPLSSGRIAIGGLPVNHDSNPYPTTFGAGVPLPPFSEWDKYNVPSAPTVEEEVRDKEKEEELLLRQQYFKEPPPDKPAGGTSSIFLPNYGSSAGDPAQRAADAGQRRAVSPPVRPGETLSEREGYELKNMKNEERSDGTKEWDGRGKGGGEEGEMSDEEEDDEDDEDDDEEEEEEEGDYEDDEGLDGGEERVVDGDRNFADSVGRSHERIPPSPTHFGSLNRHVHREGNGHH